jgi:cobalt transporter subunit CbtA
VSVFRSIVFTAAAAGLVVGLTVTAVQHVRAVPLILKAEVYEKQAEAAPHAPAPVQTAPTHEHAPGTPAHVHPAAAWEPANGLERNAYTALFNVVQWIGFGLCLAGALVLLRRPPTWREGLFWGMGGFAAFVIAPGLGLPPELPGAPVADLVARQAWWIGTAAATAGGLGLIALGRTALASAIGAALLVIPHVIGAPQAVEAASNAPEGLARQFVVAVTVTTFISWALLGVLTGYFLRRFGGSDLPA